MVGKETEYDSFYTTHFNLAFLAELGLKKGDKRIDKAVNRYLDLQKEDGDFFRHFSCLYGLMIRAFILFGYQDDPKVLKRMEQCKKMFEQYCTITQSVRAGIIVNLNIE